MTSETIGRICVRQDETLYGWSVYLCNGDTHARQVLQQFATQSEALEFAKAHQSRIKAECGTCPQINHPEECPCRNTF